MRPVDSSPLLALLLLLCASLSLLPNGNCFSLSILSHSGSLDVTSSVASWDWSGQASAEGTDGRWLRADGVVYTSRPRPDTSPLLVPSDEFSSLPAALQTLVSAHGLSTTNGDWLRVVAVNGTTAGPAVVWAVTALLVRPRVEFVSASFWCSGSLPAVDGSFICRSLGYIADPSDPSGWTANFTTALLTAGVDHTLAEVQAAVYVDVASTTTGAGEPALSNDEVRQLLAIAFTRCDELLRSNAGTVTIRSHNDRRRHLARIAVASLWAFIVVTAGFALLITGVFIPWVVSCSCVGDRLLRVHAITVLFVAMAALFAGLSVAEGLAAFVALLLIVLLAAAGISITYCIVRARLRHERAQEQRMFVEEDFMSPAAAAAIKMKQVAQSSREDSQEMDDEIEPPFEELEMEPGQLQDLDDLEQLDAMTRGGTSARASARASAAGGVVHPSTDRSVEPPPHADDVSVFHAQQEEGAVLERDEGGDLDGEGGPNGKFFAFDDEDTLVLAGAAGATAPPELDDMILVTEVRPPFTRHPHSLGARQRTLLGWAAMLALVGSVVCVAIFGIWDVPAYLVWDRNGDAITEEFMPAAIAKATFLVYAFDGFATKLKMNPIFFDVSTQWCGTHYSTQLTTPDQKHTSLYVSFIEKYSIDMSLYVPSSYLAYSTVNAWFIRDLAPGVRPLSFPSNSSVITHPCDARLMAFTTIPIDSRVWIKDEGYTVESLLGPKAYAMADFFNASMALARLAPQDYHQFHAVSGGVIVSIDRIEGTFHSVNADGITSHNYAILNQRTVVVIDTAGYGDMGHVAFVAIGALCVGSVTITPTVGSILIKGQKLGYFQFGGSTVAVIFQAGRVTFDADLLLNSRQKVETLVQMGTTLASTNY